MEISYEITGATDQMLKIVKTIDGIEQPPVLFPKGSHVDGTPAGFVITDREKFVSIPILQCPQFSSVEDAIDTLKTKEYLGFDSGSGGGGNIDPGTVLGQLINWAAGDVWAGIGTTENNATYTRIVNMGGGVFERQIIFGNADFYIKIAQGYGATDYLLLSFKSKTDDTEVNQYLSPTGFLMQSVNSSGVLSSFQFGSDAGIRTTNTGERAQRRVVATGGSADLTTRDQLVVFDKDYNAAVGFYQVSLLPAAPLNFQKFTVVNDSIAVIIIDGNGKEFFANSQYQHYLTYPGSSVDLMYDGVWHILSSVERTLNARYLSGITLNEERIAGITLSDCIVKSARVTKTSAGSGVNAYITLYVNNVVVKVFQLSSDNVDYVELNTLAQGGVEIKAKVTTAATGYSGQDISVSFDIQPI